MGLACTWGIIAWGPRFSEFLHASVASAAAPDFATILNRALAGDFEFRATVVPGGRYTDVGTYESIERLERDQVADGGAE